MRASLSLFILLVGVLEAGCDSSGAAVSGLDATASEDGSVPPPDDGGMPEPDGGGGDAARPDGGGDAARPDGPPPDGATGAPVGAACTAATDCAGDYCFADGDGWPDGYCSQTLCDLDAAETACLPYGGDGLCLDVGEAGSPFGMCFDQCTVAAPDCRPDYECLDIGAGLGVCLPVPVCGNGVVERGEECEPPSTATCTATCQGTGTAPVGAACTASTDCAGDTCFADTDGWPDGYCSQTRCDVDAPETSCLPYGGDGLCLDVGEAGSPFGMCFDQCALASPDCRADYECLDIGGGVGVCLPVPVCGNGTVERGEECEPPGTATCTATCQGVGTAPIGAACTAATECGGDTCFTDADGWPGGYCSQEGCDLGAAATSCLPYGGDGYCLDVGDTGSPYGMCFDRCAAPADCRNGYACEDLGGGLGGLCFPLPVCGNGVVERGEECEPPNVGSCSATCQGTGTAAVGAACSSDMDCAGDYCFAEGDGWPAGYCSQLECDLSAPTTSCLPYGGDGYCVDVGDVGSPYGVCFDRCVAPADCRSAYECVDVGGGLGGLCFPAPVCGNGVVERGEECEPPSVGSCTATCQGTGTAAVGATCTSNMDCAGNLCFTEAGDGFPGGYCSSDCDPAQAATSCLPFGGDGLCISMNGGGTPYPVCLDRCQNQASCRSGYVCLPVGAGRRVCWPL
jgi:hypothetical protein